jgi:hypothetical protein
MCTGSRPPVEDLADLVWPASRAVSAGRGAGVTLEATSYEVRRLLGPDQKALATAGQMIDHDARPIALEVRRCHPKPLEVHTCVA